MPPPLPEKAFPVSWDAFHRDARALAWRLADAGPFRAVVCITRGGLVPAAIVARELNLRIIETVCVTSYGAPGTQGKLELLKPPAERIVGIAGGEGRGVVIVDDLVDTGGTLGSCTSGLMSCSPRMRHFGFSNGYLASAGEVAMASRKPDLGDYSSRLDPRDEPTLGPLLETHSW